MNTYGPKEAIFSLPGQDDAMAGIVVTWRSWGVMWAWEVLSCASINNPTPAYQLVEVARGSALHVHHQDLMGNEIGPERWIA